MWAIVKFRNLWRRIERQVIYFVLFAFILVQWLAVFYAPFRPFLDEGIDTALFAMLMLAIFRVFDHQFEGQALESHGHSFEQATGAVLRQGAVVDSLDMFAHTSAKYYGVLRNKLCHIKHMRLLIAGEEGLLHFPIPDPHKCLDDLSKEVKFATNNWVNAQKEGWIEEIEIHRYNFPIYVHFMIVNGRSAEIGLFRPRHRTFGITTTGGYSYSVHNRQTVGHQIISDLQNFFNDIFEKNSAPFEQNKGTPFSNNNSEYFS
ncbi:MAG: hypothetical protein JW749_00280 [Sedimentisphaerales bacterium]|nr:hypothetical protein [Sedimentisphaerales bacterium]